MNFYQIVAMAIMASQTESAPIAVPAPYASPDPSPVAGGTWSKEGHFEYPGYTDIMPSAGPKLVYPPNYYANWNYGHRPGATKVVVADNMTSLPPCQTSEPSSSFRKKRQDVREEVNKDIRDFKSEIEQISPQPRHIESCYPVRESKFRIFGNSLPTAYLIGVLNWARPLTHTVAPGNCTSTTASQLHRNDTNGYQLRPQLSPYNVTGLATKRPWVAMAKHVFFNARLNCTSSSSISDITSAEPGEKLEQSKEPNAAEAAEAAAQNVTTKLPDRCNPKDNKTGKNGRKKRALSPNPENVYSKPMEKQLSDAKIHGTGNFVSQTIAEAGNQENKANQNLIERHSTLTNWSHRFNATKHWQHEMPPGKLPNATQPRRSQAGVV